MENKDGTENIKDNDNTNIDHVENKLPMVVPRIQHSEAILSAIAGINHFGNLLGESMFSNIGPVDFNALMKPVGFDTMIKSVRTSIPKIEFPRPLIGGLTLELPERFKAIDEKIKLLDGYHDEIFLPVYRIGLDDDLSEDTLVQSVIANKSRIYEFAKSTAEFIESKQDPLAKAFWQTIEASEADYHIPAQASAGNLLSFIREHRINTEAVKDKKVINSSITIGELEKFFESIEDNYDIGDIFLVIILVYVYQNEGRLDKNPHDPATMTNRNASVHRGIHYYSEYNSLAFILYLSEVFQLIYKIEGNAKSIVKDISNWTT